MRSALAALVVFATIVALSGQPQKLADAAPINNPAPNNDAAMQAEIARLVAVNQSLAAELAAAKATPDITPAQRPELPAQEPVSAVVSGDCANGACAVPRARVQAAAGPPRYERQRRRQRGGADGRPLTIFK